MEELRFRKEKVVAFFRERFRDEADIVMAEAAVLDLVRRKVISVVEGADLLGVQPREFLRLMTTHGVPYFSGGAEEDASAVQVPDLSSDQPSIEEKLARLAAEVPAEDWEQLPADLTDRLDHYLYGSSPS